MKKIRLYVQEALSQAVNLTLNQRQSHYIQNVMRLKKYDNIFLFNGQDGEWLGEIAGILRKLVQIKLKKHISKQQHEKSLYLYCAIIKTPALNNVIRQATEMGVTRIQFILTKHTVVQNLNFKRAKLQIIEAAEQCERMDIPEILPPINFYDLLQFQNQNFILCDKTGKSLNNVLKNKKIPAIIIGPEGGFSDDELSSANSFCQKISIGTRTLRVDTAVVAALALFRN